MEFGKTLRAAREARGKSIEEVARETRLMSQLIVDLENENMSRIAAPIYGRGFVKLYCEAVGLEARPMIDEFMKVYNGDHEPIIREREEVEGPDSYNETSLLPEEAPASAEEASPLFAAPKSFEEEPQAPSLSRYSSPLSERPSVGSGISFSIPPIVWRVGALAIVAILILWILCKVIGAIYRFSATDPNAATNEAGVEEVQSAHHGSTNVEEREPVAIPPLYID